MRAAVVCPLCNEAISQIHQAAGDARDGDANRVTAVPVLRSVQSHAHSGGAILSGADNFCQTVSVCCASNKPDPLLAERRVRAGYQCGSADVRSLVSARVKYQVKNGQTAARAALHRGDMSPHDATVYRRLCPSE